jgi:hypothetical protein
MINKNLENPEKRLDFENKAIELQTNSRMVESTEETRKLLVNEPFKIPETFCANYNREMEEQGGAIREDNGKNQLSLISPLAIESMGRILTQGAIKYERHNWRKGMKWSRCIDSLKRHLLEFEKGVDVDPESQESHLGHIMVNAMFLLEYATTHKGLDDRYKY